MAHMHTLDHIQSEPKSELQEEQVPEVFEGPQEPSVIYTNIFPVQGKPWCISPIILDFPLNHYFYVKIDCALSL
jgi:hypothetical protein